jgi:hypothetical protein
VIQTQATQTRLEIQTQATQTRLVTHTHATQNHEKISHTHEHGHQSQQFFRHSRQLL